MPPDESTVETLENAASLLAGFDIAGYAFYARWQDMVAALGGSTHEGMRRDYVRLFASGTDMALCPPVESYYRSDPSGGAVGEVGAAVVRTMKALGLNRSGRALPADHVASEFEVMSALCGREASAWEMRAGPEAVAVMLDEDRFLSLHLRRWIPSFVERVRDADAPDPYGAIVEFAHALVVHDLDYVRAARRYFEGAA